MPVLTKTRTSKAKVKSTSNHNISALPLPLPLELILEIFKFVLSSDDSLGLKFVIRLAYSSKKFLSAASLFRLPEDLLIPHDFAEETACYLLPGALKYCASCWYVYLAGGYHDQKDRWIVEEDPTHDCPTFTCPNGQRRTRFRSYLTAPQRMRAVKHKRSARLAARTRSKTNRSV